MSICGIRINDKNFQFSFGNAKRVFISNTDNEMTGKCLEEHIFLTFL